MNTADATHVKWVKAHEGHDPSDQRVLLIEELAMCMCSSCSAGDLRYRVDGEWLHSDGREGFDCDAGPMLDAAVDMGVPLYTGADLEFDTVD